MNALAAPLLVLLGAGPPLAPAGTPELTTPALPSAPSAPPKPTNPTTAAAASALTVPATRGQPTPWSLARTAAPGPASAIGRTGAGCLQGAARLPLRGDGFRVLRPGRGRVFGHPDLVALIRGWGTRLRKLGLPPLGVGDLSQPRGGPAPTGHASHQTGLDVDLAYVAGGFQSMVDAAGARPTKPFDARVVRLLEIAASDARVDRIFVNPILKKALCAAAGDDRAWLQKIRPWWGHADHFHVRLPCPTDSPTCEPQDPLPPGDGCAEIDWWLGPAAEAERRKSRDEYQSRVGAAPALPPACAVVIDAVPPGARPKQAAER